MGIGMGIVGLAAKCVSDWEKSRGEERTCTTFVKLNFVQIEIVYCLYALFTLTLCLIGTTRYPVS